MFCICSVLEIATVKKGLVDQNVISVPLASRASHIAYLAPAIELVVSMWIHVKGNASVRSV